MSRTVEQQIAEAQNKLSRLKTKQRTKDTRRKIVVGAAMLAEMRDNPAAAQLLLDTLNKRITRDVDKRDLAPVIADLEALTDGHQN